MGGKVGFVDLKPNPGIKMDSDPTGHNTGKEDLETEQDEPQHKKPRIENTNIGPVSDTDIIPLKPKVNVCLGVYCI